jgi:DNA-binding IscR family transcriptional regulator
MPATSVQFTVAAHIMSALGFRHGEELPSAILAQSVGADPTFVRKSLSKLSKAGLIVTTRCMSSVLKKAQSSFENSLDRITLADVVGEIRQGKR